MFTDGAKKSPTPAWAANMQSRLMSVASSLDKTRLVLAVIFLIVVSCLQLVDPDYFWHLKTGEYIVTNRALPSGDIFSYSRFGQPWALHEWLFEILLYAAFTLGGATGVKVLTATLLIIPISVLVRTAQRISGHAGIAMGVTLLAVISLIGSIAPRPQLVTYACFAAFLSSLLRFKYCREKISWIRMPALMVVWVNSHGGFAIGLALLGLFTACEWLSYWAAGKHDPVQRQGLIRLSKVGIATLLVSFASPGFIEQWLFPFRVLGMTANQVITEWQSPNFHDLSAQPYLVLAFAFLVSYAYRRRGPDATELLVPAFFMFAGFSGSRHIPLAALVLIPFTTHALAGGAIPAVAAAWNDSRIARWYAGQLGARELGRSEFFLNWIMLLIVLAVLVDYAPVFQKREQRRASDVFPIGAVDYVLEHGITGNIFNSYDDGGYLIYRLAPSRKVLIDGRADVYGDRFIADFVDIYSGKANWKNKFDKLSIDYAIVAKDAPVRQLLRTDPAYQEVFFDQHYAVLLRNPPPGTATR
jgi:hypothetical protein